jgi:hypothetical protein
MFWKYKENLFCFKKMSCAILFSSCILVTLKFIRPSLAEKGLKDWANKSQGILKLSLREKIKCTIYVYILEREIIFAVL